MYVPPSGSRSIRLVMSQYERHRIYPPGSRRMSAARTKLAAKRWRTSFSQLGTAPCGSSNRKSTRLNSSHITISYAVFCLKKKKADMFCTESDAVHEHRAK